MKVLVVINPFEGKERGDTITDAAQIESTLAGEHTRDVVQADHPDNPKPKSKEA